MPPVAMYGFGVTGGHWGGAYSDLLAVPYADAMLRFRLHKQRHLSGPIVESGPRVEQDIEKAWIVVESATDATAAARAATSRMIDLLVDRWGFRDVHAYLLCSVALHLRFSQVVNEPMFTVSAAMPKNVLPARELF